MVPRQEALRQENNLLVHLGALPSSHTQSAGKSFEAMLEKRRCNSSDIAVGRVGMGAEEGQRNQNLADESDSIALVTFYFFHLWDYNRVTSLTLASPPFKFFRIPLLAHFFKFIASFAMNCYSMDIRIHIYIPHITWPVCIMLLACPFSGLNILHSRTNWCAFPEGKTISPAFSIP